MCENEGEGDKEEDEERKKKGGNLCNNVVMCMHFAHLTQVGDVLFLTARHMISATCRTFHNVNEILYARVTRMHVMSGTIKYRVHRTKAHTFVRHVQRATAIGEIV